jgi:tRNA(Arg) A34 adenosine deaminase TadA
MKTSTGCAAQARRAEEKPMSEPFDHEHLMRLAIEEARRGGAAGNIAVGSVIVRAGAVIGTGHNTSRSGGDPIDHAEIVAIRDACRRLATFDLSGCEIFASCEPCPMCLAAILWARIGRVTWAGTREDAAEAGFDDARFYEEIARAPEQRTLPSGTLLRDEARALFRAWLAKPDRIAY